MTQTDHPNPYWLIERGTPAEWWAGTDRAPCWTRDVNHVHPLLKFPTREQAQGEANRIQHWPMVHGSELRVTEHLDLPEPPQDQTSDKQETPRTDAALVGWHDERMLVDLARQLEREADHHFRNFQAQSDARVAATHRAEKAERELATANANRLLAEHERNEARIALSARGTTEQEPIAWRWRNKGGQWWYREDAPANPPAVPLESDAVIEPLYPLPWSQYVKVCAHGKALNDYCEPCGRIHGG